MPKPKVRGISHKTWRSLDLLTKASLYSGDMANERVEELAADHEIGPTKAYDLRAKLLEWAHMDYLHGAEREADLLAGIETRDRTIARLKKMLEAAGVRLPSRGHDDE